MNVVFCLTKIWVKLGLIFLVKMWYTFQRDLMFEIWMNWNFKNKNISQRKKTKELWVALFLVGIFFSNVAFFLKPNLALATSCIIAADCTNAKETINTACSANGVCVPPATASSSTGAIAQPEVKTVTTTTNSNDANILKKWLQDPFYLVIKTVLFGILQLVGFLFGIVGTVFQWAVDPANISGTGGLLNKQTVRDVWVMVRDTLNMSFIMILLFAAFCTVFQVDSWNLKKVWLNILIQALLVNFSFPIARLFIDISNVAMYYFLNHLFSGTGQGSGSAIMAGFGDMSNLVGILLPNGYADADMAYLLAAIAFSFILGITLLVLAALFVVRLIALCMIVMFSPIGFVGFIFPAMSKYASQWWDNLFKYAFFGPVMVFMMMVSMQIMRAMGGNDISAFKAAASINTTSAGQANWIASSAFFLIPVGILWIAMGIANSMNIAFSKEIVGTGEKFAKWAGNLPLKGIKTAAIATGERFDRKVLKTWSPRVIKAAWDANKKAAEEKHLAVATGAWRDRLNNATSLGKNKTRFQDAAFQSTVLAKAKEFADVNQESEYLMDKYKNAMKNGNKQEMAAVLRLMFNNNDQNEFMKLQDQEVEPDAMRELIFSQLKSAGMSDEEAAKQLSDLSEIAISKGNTANYGMSTFEDGKFRKATHSEQKSASMGKVKNIKSQGKFDTWHWNSFRVENEKIEGSEKLDEDELEALYSGNLVKQDKKDPKTGKVIMNELGTEPIQELKRINGQAIKKVGRLHDFGEGQLSAGIAEGDMKAVARARADFYNVIHTDPNDPKGKDEIQAYIDKLNGLKGTAADRQQAAMIAKFVKELTGRKEGTSVEEKAAKAAVEEEKKVAAQKKKDDERDWSENL